MGHVRWRGEEVETGVFPGKILLAADGSEDSALAANAAVELSNDTGAGLHVVRVGETRAVYPPATSGPALPTTTQEETRRAARRLLDEQARKTEEAGAGVKEAHPRMGRPEEEILRLSEEMVAGLIVLGNQGLGGGFSRMRRFLMGSVSESVTRYARCSVMVVRRDLYDGPST